MFKSFSQLDSVKLTVIRSGWFNPCYQITDGTFTYAQLEYKGFLWQHAVAETSEARWNIHSEGMFPRRIIVTNRDRKKVASIEVVWAKKAAVLTLSGGKQLRFVKESFWKSIFHWNDPKAGKILTITADLFSRKFATVHLEDKVISDPLIPLLSLLSIHLILMKRRKQAAAA